MKTTACCPSGDVNNLNRIGLNFKALYEHVLYINDEK